MSFPATKREFSSNNNSQIGTPNNDNNSEMKTVHVDRLGESISTTNAELDQAKNKNSSPNDDDKQNQTPAVLSATLLEKWNFSAGDRWKK